MLNQDLELVRDLVEATALLAQGFVELTQELVLVSVSALEVGDLFVHGVSVYWAPARRQAPSIMTRPRCPAPADASWPPSPFSTLRGSIPGSAE